MQDSDDAGRWIVRLTSETSMVQLGEVQSCGDGDGDGVSSLGWDLISHGLPSCSRRSNRYRLLASNPIQEETENSASEFPPHSSFTYIIIYGSTATAICNNGIFIFVCISPYTNQHHVLFREEI